MTTNPAHGVFATFLPDLEKMPGEAKERFAKSCEGLLLADRAGTASDYLKEALEIIEICKPHFHPWRINAMSVWDRETSLAFCQAALSFIKGTR